MEWWATEIGVVKNISEPLQGANKEPLKKMCGVSWSGKYLDGQ
jgi:hypothetical protein